MSEQIEKCPNCEIPMRIENAFFGIAPCVEHSWEDNEKICWLRDLELDDENWNSLVRRIRYNVSVEFVQRCEDAMDKNSETKGFPLPSWHLYPQVIADELSSLKSEAGV